MSETGSGATRADRGKERGDELDDPGRDPAGLNPPRNVLFGTTQDSGQGAPRGEGNVGPADKPEAPTDDPQTRADEPDRP